ncbi:MAG: hypothetical protein RLZZ445_1936 [Pseudomonadota bacterium]|jgi:hypothetical protein
MSRSYPRLKLGHAKKLLAGLSGILQASDDQNYRALLNKPLPDLSTETFAASGLPRVTASELLELRERLNGVMEAAGFPAVRLETRQAVDLGIAKALATWGFPKGEMLRPDVWWWLCVHLMPHYVFWRWQKTDGSITENRVIGAYVRNALGRLWYRATVLDLGTESPDRWKLLDRINEDASTALLERTSVSSNDRLSKCLTEVWLGLSSSDSAKSWRNIMVRARVQASLIETAVLDDDDLKREIEQNFI